MKIKKFLCLALAAGMVVTSNPVSEERSAYAEDTLVGSLFFDWDFEGLNTDYYVSVLKKFDTNNDGRLSVDEQLAVEEIRLIEGTTSEEVVNTPVVSELPHLDAFKNLKRLFIYDFNVFDLDLTKNEKLEQLSISKSLGVNDIKLAGLKNLQVVMIGLTTEKNANNSFTSFDFSGCSALDTVMIGNCSNLEKVNLSGCSALDAFTITGSDKIKSLDFSDCKKLRYFGSSNNESLKTIYVPSSFTEKNLAHKWEEGKAGNGSALVSGFYYDLPCTVYFGKPGSESISRKFTGDPSKIDPNTGSYNASNTTQVKIFAYKNNYYRILSKNKVAFTSTVNKKIKSIVIPATVKYNGKTYKVTKVSDNSGTWYDNVKKITFGKNITTIGKNSFHCPKLSKIIFKGTAVKKIKKKSILDVKKKVKVKAPKKVKKKYIRFLKKSGLKKVK